MANESTLERRIKRYAESKGCFFWKFVSPSTKGVPDRLIIAPNGTVAFLEIKAPGEAPNKLQEHRMKELRGRFVPSTWVSHYEVAVGYINSLCEPKL